jgi:hypothetical protein
MKCREVKEGKGNGIFLYIGSESFKKGFKRN